MQELLNTSTLNLTSLIDAAPVGVMLCDKQGTICFVNKAIENIFGYTSDALAGKKVEVLLPAGMRDQHELLRSQFFDGKKSRLIGKGVPLAAVHALGHALQVEIGITTLDALDQTYAIAFVIDVSARHREDRRIRYLMESMPFGLLLIDENGAIQMTNEEFNRIFGYTADELIGMKVEVLIPERLRLSHVSFRDAFSKVPQSRKMGSGRELLAIRKNGLEFPAEIALTPLNDDGKKRVLVALSDVSVRKQMENTLRRQSLFDSLTSLPNRNLFFDRLEQACIKYARQRVGFAVLMIDLNRFKEVNDTLGHPVGDIVLRDVSQRLAMIMRKSDSIARLGGDEFAALLHDIEKEEDAVRLAEKLVDAVRKPVMVGTHALTIGISIGIALCPKHGVDQTSLIAHADHAMYQAKRGLHSIAVDGGNAREVLAPPQAVTTEIELALQRKELQFYYQPKIDLTNGELVGVEALIRWLRPNGEVISPIEFMPAVEDSGMLEHFTLATLDMALAQLRSFLEMGHEIGVAVNISARMLGHDQLEDRIIASLKRYSVPPGLLTLEITETALVVNPVKARRAIDLLEQYGVQFSIDDFGAGFTSFKYLKSFRIAEIKIDQEFVTAIEKGSFDANLVQSIAGFCKGLNIRLVAEGIESESDFLILQQLGCQFGQGYHIARPMPVDDFLAWMHNRHRNMGQPDGG